MVEQLLPVVDIESNYCINMKIMIFVLIIIILFGVMKNLTNPGILHCINTKKLELYGGTNIEDSARKLKLTDKKNKKENLMNGDIVNMNYINRKKDKKDIIGKYIEIRNDNRKEIPINTVIIMNDNRELIPLHDFTTQYTKTGIIYTYTIPDIQKISRIILDICIYNHFIDNVKTSHVSILDSNKNIIWKYNHMIYTDRRYHSIDISDPTIVYDRPVNLLCTNEDEDCMQEKQLVISLARNVWQS